MVYKPKLFLEDFKENQISKTILLNSVKTQISGLVRKVLRYDPSGLSGTIAGAILDRYNINEDTLDFYQFRINPRDLDVTKAKIRADRLTGGGYQMDTRGERLITYRFSGTTGSLMPEFLSQYDVTQVFELGLRQLLLQQNDDPKIAAIRQAQLLSRISPDGGTLINSLIPDITDILYNPMFSATYVKFLLFDKFWSFNNDHLVFVWEDNMYIGKFGNFHWKITATEPYQIFYDFDLTVYPEFVYNLTVGSVDAFDIEQITKMFLRETYVKEFDAVLVAEGTDSGGGNDEQEIDAQKEFFRKMGRWTFDKDKWNYRIVRQRNRQYITPKDIAKAYSIPSIIDMYEEVSDINLDMNTISTALSYTQSEVPVSQETDAKETEQKNEQLENKEGY